MVNFLFFVGAIGFISWQLSVFLKDVWLRDAQQKQLRQKFEDWWLTVADLDKLKLALACTIQLNGYLDKVFGAKCFSRLAFWRVFVMASGLLIASLALHGLFNYERFGGVEPWRNYRETASGVEKFVPQLQSSYRAMPKISLVTNVQLNASHILTTNVVAVTNTATIEVIDALEKVKLATEKYSASTYVWIYSVLFLVILVFLNALHCFCSLVISRLILREIIAAARPYSTFCLLITNLFLVINMSSVFLLLLTILNTPIMWYFLPVIFIFAAHSFTVFLLFFFGGQIVSWIFGSPALKLVTLIAFLPFIFTFAVSAFSYMAMIWRNAFHKCVSAVLLRCAEKGPLAVIVTTSAIIASLIAGLGKLIHWIR